MFSNNLKRSVATLGVVAGLLVAAGPASAQVMPGMIGVKAPTSAEHHTPLILPGTADDQMTYYLEGAWTSIIVFDFEAEAVKGNNGAPGR